jgi:hypothetical protein
MKSAALKWKALSDKAKEVSSKREGRGMEGGKEEQGEGGKERRTVRGRVKSSRDGEGGEGGGVGINMVR